MNPEQRLMQSTAMDTAKELMSRAAEAIMRNDPRGVSMATDALAAQLAAMPENAPNRKIIEDLTRQTLLLIERARILSTLPQERAAEIENPWLQEYLKPVGLPQNIVTSTQAGRSKKTPTIIAELQKYLNQRRRISSRK